MIYFNVIGHRLKINSIGFYPDDEASICATGSQEGRTKLWDVRRKGFFRYVFNLDENITFGVKNVTIDYRNNLILSIGSLK